MTLGRKAAFAVIGLLCAGVLSASPRAFADGPDDIVPLGDVAYDLLGSLSAAGRVPGHTLADLFRGDRLYTRREMARMVASVSTTDPNHGALSGPQAEELRALSFEFAPELHALHTAAVSTGASHDGALTALVKLRLGAQPASGDIIGRMSLTTPVGRDGYAAVSAGDYRQEWYSIKLQGDFPPVETLFVRYNTPALDFTVGRFPIRWGPGYSGTLLLGDNAPSLPQIRFEKGFVLPGSFGRQIGHLYFTQFSGEEYEDAVPDVTADATGTQRFIFGRRLETAGDRSPWHLSLSESFKSTRLPGAGWALVLPFYAYQDAFTLYPGRNDHRLLGFLADGHTYPDTAWFNYLADVQVVYRTIPARDAAVYADLLIDDIQAPEGFRADNTPVPQKLGLLLGTNFPRLGPTDRYGLRLEYTTIDPNTYGSESPPVAYNYRGAPLGYAYFGNTVLYFGRFDARVTNRVKAAAEVSIQRRDYDDQPGPTGERYSLYANYTVHRDSFIGLRLDEAVGDVLIPAAAVPGQSRAEVSFGFGL